MKTIVFCARDQHADAVAIADIWAGRDPDTTITSAGALARAVTSLAAVPAMAAGSVDRLRTQVFIVTRVGLGLIVIAIVIFEGFATQIVDIYLGPAFAGSVSTLRVLMLGALPWGIYMSLRTVIDARHKRAVNAINVGVSFAFFVALMLVMRIWMDPAAVVVPVFVVSLYLLGALTAIEIWRMRSRARKVLTTVPSVRAVRSHSLSSSTARI